MSQMLTDSPQQPWKLPALAITAASVSFLLTIVMLLAAFQQVYLVVSALIVAMAGITIMRRRAWGAYGFALFELAQIGITPIVLGSSKVSTAYFALVIVSNLGLSVLFFLAGRSLTAAGASRGAVVPWIALSCLFTLPFLFVRGYVIPTTSMENTLLLGDHILVRTFPRVTPARGEIIVFRYPVDTAQTFLKRVIGMPGDRIKLINNVVYRNGVRLDEPYAVHKMQFPNSYAENFPSEKPNSMGRLDPFLRDMFENHIVKGELVVPARKYFTLGDNRDNSLDSRFWGFVDASDIIGKPLLIYGSEEKQDVLVGPQTKSITRVRWARVLKII
ncbi:MAG TPA: signal peptidase I [Bryobacteraceae bacterium]|jgi:signal peptidase I|nr:signal peptidase I [Bryobacteraceae bacterium]